MPFNSTLNVLINEADITVLGPPNTIEIEVDRGAKGDRGTKTFYGGIDPNSLTPSQFSTAYGYLPIYGDQFISTVAGPNYGQYYVYSYVPGGDEWTASFSLQSAASEMFYTGNFTWSASAFPNVDLINASSASATTALWGNLTTGSIDIGSGVTTGSIDIGDSVTTGTVRIAAFGTGVTPITIGHTNSLISLVGDTTITGRSIVSTNSTSAAFKITQAGAGDAFVVEDVASDTTPFVINANGQVGIGSTTGPTGSSKVKIQESGASQLALANSAGVQKAYFGTIGAFGAASTDSLRIRSEGTEIVFGFNGAVAARLANDGNFSTVGPSVILNGDVAGAPSLNASIVANRGSSTDVSIRWNETLDQWEYTNDGSTFQGIGSGGASGFETVMFFAGV
jgi:hypothetical protein